MRTTITCVVLVITHKMSLCDSKFQLKSQVTKALGNCFNKPYILVDAFRNVTLFYDKTIMTVTISLHSLGYKEKHRQENQLVELDRKVFFKFEKVKKNRNKNHKEMTTRFDIE